MFVPKTNDEHFITVQCKNSLATITAMNVMSNGGLKRELSSRGFAKPKDHSRQTGVIYAFYGHACAKNGLNNATSIGRGQ